MQRILTLIDKIKELHERPNISAIEIDLMMDYTRVLYADMLEWRNKVSFTQNLNSGTTQKPVSQPLPSEPLPAVLEVHPEKTAPAIELDITSIHYEPETATEPQIEQPPSMRPPARDIRKTVGINDKYQFISELFGNNKDAYEQVMSDLNRFDNEEEALTWLHESLYGQYNWDTESPVVQSFYMLLSDFFSSGD